MCQQNGSNQCFSGCLLQNVEESGYGLSSWSVSTGYSALMLTRQLRALLVNISAKYPALPDLD